LHVQYDVYLLQLGFQLVRTVYLCYVSLCKSQHLNGKSMCKKSLRPTHDTILAAVKF